MTYLDNRVTIHPGDHSLVKVVEVEVSDDVLSQTYDDFYVEHN